MHIYVFIKTQRERDREIEQIAGCFVYLEIKSQKSRNVLLEL